MGDTESRAVWQANARAWTELSRAGYDVYRDLVNTPAFLDTLPPVRGLFGLDVGCGEGHNTRLVAQLGAKMIALDIVPEFVTAAAQASEDGTSFILGDACTLPFDHARFDFVVAFMSLMDVDRPERALGEVARVLKPNGFLQFSIVHPATNTRIRRWVTNEAGERDALAVGDYFYEGPFDETFLFGSVPEELRTRYRPFTIRYARRTLSSWMNAVVDTGFAIEMTAEPHASPKVAKEHPEVSDTRVAPYFLHIRARKRP
jgi:ubiquinone/menaquinone biosynthesis C-methylase UbiE